MGVPQGRYIRRSWKAVQAPRTQAAAEKPSRLVGTDDVRGRGYRPHAVTQQQDVTMNERPARKAQTTHAAGDTGPTHSGSGWRSVPWGRCGRQPQYGVQAPRSQTATGCVTDRASLEVGTEDSRGRGYRPQTRKQQQNVTLNERQTRSIQTMLAKGGTSPTHSSSG